MAELAALAGTLVGGGGAAAGAGAGAAAGAGLSFGTVLSAVGTGLSAVGTLAAGAQAEKAAKFKAAQEAQAAQEARASAQRQSLERRRQTNLTQSTLIARAAASGADASDPDVQNLGQSIAARGEYQALMEMYNGENRAQGLLSQSEADLYEGKAAKRNSFFKAAGTLASGFGGKSALSTRFSSDYGYS